LTGSVDSRINTADKALEAMSALDKMKEEAEKQLALWKAAKAKQDATKESGSADK
jgi:hypothetical protein